MNTDLAKRTILPAYIKYQDDLNADRKVKGLEFADIEFKKIDSRKAYYRIFEKFNVKPLEEF